MSKTNDDTHFEVYFGDGQDLHRQTFSLSGPTGTGTWINPKSDHSDPSDIAFDSEFRIPILLATDGGVHVTSDSGSTWILTGGGYGGFDALQIAELTGQVSGTQQFLYFGTQDNSMRASTDGGASWPTSIYGEGRYIRATVTRVTGSGCGNCMNFVSQPGFQNPVGWPNAPDGNTATAPDTPFLLSGDAYIQDVADTATTPPTYDFFLTSTVGASWSKSFSLSGTQPKGAALVAGPANNPTVFQGIQVAGAIPNGGIRFGMVRASNLFSQPIVASADASGTVAFGSLRTPIARYVVLGVDPNNPSHLLAPDVENSEMKFSDDGGNTWNSLPQLTQAVTSGGQYLFTLDELSLASVITWDPYDSCDILVGTMQNGILRSTDGGNTWTQIAGSKAVTYVTSFYFPPKGSIWVSTTGRGLWTLDLSRNTTNPGQCRFPGSPVIILPENGVMAVDLATGSSQPFLGVRDPALCADCSVLVVRNGWITDLQTSGEIRQVAISGGTISQLDRTGKEIPLTVPSVYQPGDGKLRSRMPRSADLGSARVRGLILERNRILRVIVSRSELPFAPERTPTIFLYSASKAGSPSLTSGEKVRVMGASFLPTSHTTGSIRISFDGKVAAENVKVRPDGSFSVDISVRHLPGEMVATAEQRDGMRLTITRALIDISAQDGEK